MPAPGLIAGLAAAFEMYLEFSEECGAIDTGLRQSLFQECWTALLAAA